MISKLAKAHESWIFKLISAAVAVSFVSLFGVTGYISSASQNQTVISVGNKKLSQSEFSYKLQRNINTIKKNLSDDVEITDALRSSLTEATIADFVNNSVIELEQKKHNIYFPKVIIQQNIAGNLLFRDAQTGQFRPDFFNLYLSNLGLSEEEYVANVERALASRLLVDDPIKNFNVPKVLANAVHKMDNQRKTFKYVVVTPEDITVERKISDDEVKQYYEDFAETFTVPETRDADILFISNDEILNKYVSSPEQVKDYFEQHKADFAKPEHREIKQMVFVDKDIAEKALAAVKEGKNFEETAKEFKAENASEPTLGKVAEDELAESLADVAFKMNVNDVQLVQVADSWQVISVGSIEEAKAPDFEAAKDEISDLLYEENFYDAIRQVQADIDDAVNGGKSLEEVAEILGLKVVSVAGVREEEIIESAPESIKSLVSTLDFNEAIFSYGLNEISSADEFDDGIAVFKITGIKEPYQADIEDVRGKIVEMWTVQEKAALAKEIADNIAADATDGSQLADAAKARNLEAFRSEPISRNERFAGLSQADISDLFLAEENSVKLIEYSDNHFVIASPVETVNYNDELTDEAMENIAYRLSATMMADMRKAALDNYASDFKIKIDYKKAGFAE